LLRGYSSQVATPLHRLPPERYFWLSRIVSSFLTGIQLWLFTCAPVNGYGLSVSLGYFIMPITYRARRALSLSRPHVALPAVSLLVSTNPLS
ncbi:hypothetical protein K6U50_05545, partial [Vibrio fluvialis]|nr:hypothetical protein [Vibrio fluvialis]